MQLLLTSAVCRCVDITGRNRASVAMKSTGVSTNCTKSSEIEPYSCMQRERAVTGPVADISALTMLSMIRGFVPIFQPQTTAAAGQRLPKHVMQDIPRARTLG